MTEKKIHDFTSRVMQRIAWHITWLWSLTYPEEEYSLVSEVGVVTEPERDEKHDDTEQQVAGQRAGHQVPVEDPERSSNQHTPAHAHQGELEQAVPRLRGTRRVRLGTCWTLVSFHFIVGIFLENWNRAPDFLLWLPSALWKLCWAISVRTVLLKEGRQQVLHLHWRH